MEFDVLIALLTVGMWIPGVVVSRRLRAGDALSGTPCVRVLPRVVTPGCESESVRNLMVGELDRDSYRARMERIAAADAGPYPLVVPESS